MIEFEILEVKVFNVWRNEDQSKSYSVFLLIRADNDYQLTGTQLLKEHVRMDVIQFTDENKTSYHYDQGTCASAFLRKSYAPKYVQGNNCLLGSKHLTKKY